MHLMGTFSARFSTARLPINSPSLIAFSAISALTNHLRMTENRVSSMLINYNDIVNSIMNYAFFFFFFFIFSHFYVGSMCLVRRLHLDRSCASSSDNPLSDKSFLMLSIHLRFGLPLLLFPGTSIPNTLFPTYSSSLLETCPYHFNLLSCTFLDISPTFMNYALTADIMY